MKTKNIQYINKDFSSIRQSLIDYAKTYFPNTYNDFSPSSPGMMFIEMAAYVGDMLSYNLDAQFQETLLNYAKEKENLFSLAYMLGYRPKITAASTVNIDFYQLLPAILSGSTMIPDFNYALIINGNSQINSTSNPNISFYVHDKIDFSYSSSFSPTELSVYQLNAGQPEYYLLKKTAKGISGTLKTSEYVFGSPERFKSITLEDSNIIQIVNVIDSDGNTWYEVPNLAQETIYEDLPNINTNDPNFSNNGNEVSYLLRLKKVPRRFTTKFKTDKTMEIEFGSGIYSNADEEIIPNPNNVGIGNISNINKLDTAYDPSNFLYTGTYGLSPSNTTLTITYLVGGGASANVPSNDLTDITLINMDFINGGLNPELAGIIKGSIATNNPEAATGGGDGDDVEQIRQNTLSSFPAQLRAVNKEDYIIRALSMPTRYGTLSKAYVIQDQILSNNSTNDSIIDSNPLSLSMYILSSNAQGQLVNASQALKQNLKTYISQYRMLTDAINIKDAYIINIGVKFNILALPNYNSNEILLRCIESLQNYFNINKWQINQPIILSEIYTLLDQLKGVQTVQNVEIINKVGTAFGYSQYDYDLKAATRNNIIYPSLDPCIFEIKYPTDIVGRISTI